MKKIDGAAAFNAAIGAPVVVAFFSASWSQPCDHMRDAIKVLSVKVPSVTFLEVDAEDVDDVSDKYGIESVPEFLFFKEGKEAAPKLVGADAAQLSASVRALGVQFVEDAVAPSEPKNHPESNLPMDLHNRLASLVKRDPIMIFMKGSPNEPRCKFSRRMMELLKEQNITTFGHFDILQDEDVRQGLKAFSHWPTFPQVYYNGKLVGGLDILLEMAGDDELRAALGFE
eukprot:Rmarinus@m.10071